MASLSDLAYTDNMASNKQPFLTDIRSTLTSIQTYINDSIKDNLIQAVNDAFSTAYSLDSDGAQQFTTGTLYNKWKAEASYSSANFTISTTAAWTDVDATNVKVEITPELTGDFIAKFQFNVQYITTNATNECNVKFRLTDSTETSTYIPKVHLVTGVTGTTTTVPVKLEHRFDSWSAALKSVKLQYYITTLTAGSLNILANSDHPILMNIEKL